MQTRHSRNIIAALDLPAPHVESMAAQSAQMHHLTFAQLIAMVGRIDRSRASAAQARAASPAGQMTKALDQIDAQLSCMWAVVEGELERRMGCH